MERARKSGLPSSAVARTKIEAIYCFTRRILLHPAGREKSYENAVAYLRIIFAGSIFVDFAAGSQQWCGFLPLVVSGTRHMNQFAGSLDTYSVPYLPVNCFWTSSRHPSVNPSFRTIAYTLLENSII